MNIPKMIHHPLTEFLLACAFFPLLLSACQPLAAPTLPPTLPPEALVLPTQEPVQATQPVSSPSAEFALDFTGLAQSQTLEAVDAVSASDTDGPWFLNMPQYRRLTLEGYPLANRFVKPQIFVFPVKDLAENKAAGKAVEDLKVLLETRKAGESLPFLPLFNDQQVMHAQVKFMDFKTGKGVRFLTQYDQGPLQINNEELFYTFQGLTGDGKFYIAALLPVSHPQLPAAAQVFSQSAGEMKDYPAYLAETAAWLDGQTAASFSPDLARLDALIQSIEVK